MDCRMRLSLVLGLIVGLGGCSQTLPVTSSSKPTSPHSPAQDITHNASTYTAFADMQARSAESPQHAEPQKQQFRERAKLSYLKALEVDPRYLPAYVGLAQVQMATQDHAGALAIYRKAIELSPREGQLWFELGICHCRTKDWSAALTSFNKAMELEPTNAQYTKTAGLTLARAGKWQDAYVMLARVEGEAKAHYSLARMHKHTNQLDLARRHASAALVVDPSFELARTFLIELEQPNTKATPPAATESSMTAPSHLPASVQRSANPIAQPIVQTGMNTPVQPMNLEGVSEKPVRVPPLPVIKLSGEK